jgi:hypothetical protein
LSVDVPTDAEFTLTLSAGSDVLPGGEQRIPISFSPFTVGPKIGTSVILTDSRQTRLLNLTLSGTGVH